MGAIDFNILMMIAGTMGIVTLFIESKMPMRIADVMLSKFKNVKMAIVAMAVLSGVVSAFVDNVATVLMIAHIALAVSKKQNISPRGGHYFHRGLLEFAGRGHPGGRHHLHPAGRLRRDELL